MKEKKQYVYRVSLKVETSTVDQYLLEKVPLGDDWLEAEAEESYIADVPAGFGGEADREDNGTVIWGMLDEGDIYCNCMGFRMQKYSKLMHKHHQIVFDYITRGCPTKALYKLGKNNLVEFIRAS